MKSRILSLVKRYGVRHSCHSLGPRPYVNLDGSAFACLDRVVYDCGRVRLEGWSLGSSLILLSDQPDLVIENRFARADLQTAGVLSAAETDKPGFFVDIPWDGGALHLAVELDGCIHVLDVPFPQSRDWLASLPRVLPDLVWTLGSHPGDVMRVVTRNDDAARLRMRELLGLNTVMVSPRRTIADDLFTTPPVGDVPPPSPITVVIPVYNAFDLLPELLDRVARNTDLPAHVIVVEDASPDERVRPHLRDWAAGRTDGLVTVELLENPENLGFIGSVNRALAAALNRDGPVILLNSDAMVPPGWASRMIAPLLADPTVASVTPMSNDAEIFSVPSICRRIDLAPGTAEAIDAAARHMAPGSARAVAPTGVGFCMALNPAFLRRVPQLDTAFGRGYGEEVDWCQRVRALGGHHLGIANLFVEHRGGASFGSAEKLKLVARNNAMVAERYPSYDRQVQDFIHADPLNAPRLVLALAWAFATASEPLAIFVGHSLGGGAESYLKRRVAQEVAANGAAVVLRLGGPLRWQIELHGPEGAPQAATDSADLLRAIFAQAGARRLIYSCAVGDPDPVSAPTVLLDLVDPARDSVEILMHDFFPLSPSYTLLGSDGRFHGTPAADDTDPAHQAPRPDGTMASLAQWRAAWGALVTAADQVTVFSSSSRALVTAAYPDAAARMSLQPHDDVHPVPRISSRRSGANGIGVLGDIGFQKGAEMLQRLAPALAAQGGALAIVGKVDPNYAPPPEVPVHGQYDLSDLDRIATRYGIDRWLIPSIWPETFSYTTHEALASGLPVFCFDLGGQAEAVGRAPNGHVLPLALADDADGLAVALMRRSAAPDNQTLESQPAEV
ncbi:MAG: glycosyltransferase [Rhodobacteraceae bacterium]|nr:glycosyltransferase [Paracoccaceae bacterium]